MRGVEDPAEGNMDYLAEQRGVVPTLIPSMRRDPGLGDLLALLRIVLLLWRDRPAIVHTHAAKGGTLGRVATLLAFPAAAWRPLVIHTYHGHSLTGYFSGRTAGSTGWSRSCSRRAPTSCSRSRARFATTWSGWRRAGAQFRVMPLGFDLTPFTGDVDRAPGAEALRAALGRRRRGARGHPDRAAGPDQAGRSLPGGRAAARRPPNVRFVVIGDGELREELASSDDAAAWASASSGPASGATSPMSALPATS